MRIVSLLPSATEIVCVLGLGDRLVGVTHECDFPESVRHLPQVTRSRIPTSAESGEIDRLVREHLRSKQALYTLDLPTLERLRPDLIVTQALCDVCAVAEEEVRSAACALPGSPRVINLEPQTLGEVLDSIRRVGEATGVESVAEEVVQGLRRRVDAVAARSARLTRRPRVAILEWLDPPFSSGHWSPELVRLAGGVEVLGSEGQRSRTLRWDEVVEADPEMVVVSLCGFGVERTLRDLALIGANPMWRRLRAVGTEQVYVVDGSQYFSRPGPRLVDSIEMLAHALDPEIHPLPVGIPAPLRVSGNGSVIHAGVTGGAL